MSKEDYADLIEYYKNLKLPLCPYCESNRTSIVKCGIVGASMTVAANTPKIHLIPYGKHDRYYCRNCKKYFND